MTIYLLNLIVVYICSFLARIVPAAKAFAASGRRLWACPVFIASASLIFLEGLRHRVGTDYWNYYMIFAAMTPENWNSGDLEIGFMALCKLLKLVTLDPQFIFFVVALATNILAVKIIMDHGEPFELAMFIFLTLGVYYTSFNGMRQMLAAMIVFLGTRYLFEGRFFKFSLLALLACTIHTSAVFMIPIFFVVRRKAFTRLTLIITGAFIAGAFFYGELLSLLGTVLGSSRYQNYTQFAAQSGEGANILRFLVASAPVLFSFIFRRRLEKLGGHSDYLINLCLLNALVMLIATRHWVFARISMLLEPYSILLIPQFTRIFDRRTNALVYAGLIAMYFIYGLFFLKYDSNLLPYRWTLIDFSWR